MLTEYILDILISIVFIGMFENFFLISFMLIKANIHPLSNKSILLVFLTSVVSVCLKTNLEVFVIDLLIKMVFVIGMICILYQKVEAKKLIIGFFQAFAWFALIETVIYFPLSEFLYLNIELIRQDLTKTILLSIPTRIVEMAFIYKLYTNHKKKSEVL